MASFLLKCLLFVLQCLALGLLAFLLRIDMLSGVCILTTEPRSSLKWVYLGDILITGAVYRAVYVFMRKLIKDTVVALRKRET